MAIQFPSNPGIGSVFTDIDAGFSYEWDGTVWKSFTPAASSNVRELDDISSSFDNSTTTFNLTIGGAAYSPLNAAMLQISLGGVIQEPGTDYTVFTSTITFTTAPNSGLDFFGVVRGTAVTIDYANDGNVQTKQEFTATEGQTSFTVTGGYRTGYVDVFRNGVRLGSDDFTDTSGTAIVLTVAAQADDLIEVVKYNVASLVVSEGQFTNLNVTGIITGGSFSGDGSGLTGVASTDNIQTATPAKFLSDVSITGVTTVGVVTGGTSISAGVFYGDGSALTGIDATRLTDSGGSTIVQANSNGAVVTGVLTATTGSFSGNVTIGGTLTYQDVDNIDSIGIITAQQGIQVLANGVDVTGIGTFEDRLTYDGSLGQAGGGTVTYTVTVASKDSTHRYNGSGFGSGYVIDNLQAPVLTLTPGRTYRFDQSDSSNSGHPLRFYYQADKTTQYSTDVTVSGTPGTDGYTEITITDTTPVVLHYQCSSHSLMGNAVATQSNPIVGAGITLNADGGGVHVTGIITATSFVGDGSALTGVGVGTEDNINTSGIITATSFVGSGSSLTFAPKIIAFDPLALQQNVAVGSSIHITFDQNIYFNGSGDIVIREGSSDGTGIQTFSISSGVGTTGLSIVDTQLIIEPSSNFNLGTSIYVTLPSTGIANTEGDFFAGSTNYNFGTVVETFSAEGGDHVYTLSDVSSPTGYYRYHIFTSSGILTTTSASQNSPDFSLLLIGGGGGGAGQFPSGDGSDSGGGGGAGGLISHTGPTLSLATGTYTITIGAGGQPNFNPGGGGAPNPRGGSSGLDSTIAPPTAPTTFVLRAYGGGAGDSSSTSEPLSPVSGGSGGGARSNASPNTEFISPGTAIPGQGNVGGNGIPSNSYPGSSENSGVASGGGGGAGGAAPNSTPERFYDPIGTWIVGGAGGTGSPITAFKSPNLSGYTPTLPAVTLSAIGPTGMFAGGGGGSGENWGGSGGAGGGGTGSGGNSTTPIPQAPFVPAPIRNNDPTSHAGADYTGGGGGAGQYSGAGGNGGSGVMMIRYAAPSPS